MPNYLIVANQTLGGKQLTDRVSELITEGGPTITTLRFMVPVTETDGTHQWDYPPIDRYIPDARALARMLAEARLERELERLRASGVRADGEVTDPNPIERIKSVVGDEEYTAVIVSTLPRTLSRWLHADLPHRVARALSVPVVHVEGAAGPSL
jgi:nucleotide-binding universal stress UspA family protein